MMDTSSCTRPFTAISVIRHIKGVQTVTLRRGVQVILFLPWYPPRFLKRQEIWDRGSTHQYDCIRRTS